MHYFANVICFAWRYSIPVIVRYRGLVAVAAIMHGDVRDSLQALDMYNILSKYTGRPSSVSVDISNAIT